MAMLLLPLAGALMAPAGYAAVGWAVGSMAATLLFPQKMPGQEGPRVSDLKIQSSAEGVGIPQVFGTMRLAGNVIDAADLREVKKTEEVDGGKGGGTDVTTYSYYGTWAIGLCEGPAAGIRRIWADHKLIYDASPGGGGEISAVRGRIKIYNGSATQMPDPALEALHGAGNVPAYRGLCYIVFSDVLLSDWGNRIPNITAEVVMEGTAGTTVTALAHPTVKGSCYDSNRHVMYVTSPGLWRVTMDGTYESINIQSDVLNITLVAAESGNSIVYDPVHDCLYTTAWNNLKDQYMIVRVDPETGWITGAHNTGDNLCQSFALDDVNDKLWAKVVNAAYLYNESDILSIHRGEYHLSPPTRLSIGNVQFMTADSSRIAFDNSTNTLLVAWYDTSPDPDVVTYYGIHGSADEYYDIVVRWQFTSPDGLRGVVSDDDGYFYAVTSANEILKINSQTGARSTLRAGGLGAAAHAVSLDASRQNLLVSHVNSGVDYYGLSLISTTTGEQIAGYSLNGAEYAGMATLQAWDESSMGALRHPYGTVYRDRITAGATSVASVISALAQKAPLTAADLDVTALANVPVLGYVRPDIMSPRDSLASLFTAFFVDCVETGDKLKFSQRGADSVAAISYQDTAATNGSAVDTSILDVTLAQEYELPREVAVRFTDRNNEYDVGLARAQRQLTASVSVSQAEFPIALTHDSAQQIADVLLATAWMQSRAYKFSLDYGYLKLEPGDPVTLTLEDGRVLSALLTKSEYDMLYGTVQCEAVAYDKDLYKPVSQTDDYTPATLALTTGVKVQMIEPPALVDADLNTPVLYATAAPYAGAWRGAALYKSTDDLNYTRIGDFPAQGAQGLALTALASGDTTVWDTTNTLRVRLFGGSTLSSNTEAAVLNGANAAWVGDEIIQWQTATLEPDGSYTLSNLLRGRLGTEHAVGTHAAGESFVLLSTTAVLRVPVEISELGLTRYYKAVPYGLALSSAVKRTVACSGANLKPYAPVNLAGSRDGSGNLALSWTRRSRLGSVLVDYLDVPLNEQSEQYHVELLNGETVVRTLTVTSPSAGYSAAEQVADFGSTQASVAIRVYQISATVGRGHAAAATV